MLARPRAIAVVAVALAAGSLPPFAAPLRSDPSPRGGELQLNAYTTGSQHAPAIARAAQGGFVVAWSSYGSYGSDTNASSVQVRLFDADFEALAPDLQVNTFTNGEQGVPAVASDSQGRFVVVWESQGSPGNDSSQTSVQGQRFDAAGDPVGPQFQVNSYTTSYQKAAAIAANALGRFVVVWESFGSSGTDTSEWSVQAQLYDENGAPVGSQFQVNGFTTDRQLHSAVAMDPAGGFVVAWSSFGSLGSDTSANSIQAQRFDEYGSALGVQLQVNTYTTNYQFNPAIAVGGTGNFVVIWGSVGSYGPDTSSSSIQGQRFDAGGVALGGQFQVNSYTSFNQHQPAVAVDARGDFVVTWQSEGSSGTDGSDYSIQLQRFRADGAPLDGQSQVNTYTTGHQGLPAVAVDGSGNFVVVWGSDGSAGSDTSESSVLAQFYDGLFRDGFESGDTSAWSSAVP